MTLKSCKVDDCPRPTFGKGFCTMHYQRARKHGDPQITLAPVAHKRPDIATRLLSKAVEDPITGCWNWIGWKNNTGYGVLYVVGAGSANRMLAHRVSYDLHKGEIADGLQVDHVCHNRDLACRGGHSCPHRACINPEHLEAVTNRVNGIRGRAAQSAAERAAQRTTCNYGHPFDELNTYWTHSNSRACRTCSRQRGRAEKGNPAMQVFGPLRRVVRRVEHGRLLECGHVATHGRRHEDPVRMRCMPCDHALAGVA